MKARINKKISNEDIIHNLFSQYLKFINYSQIPFPNDVKIIMKDILAMNPKEKEYESSGSVGLSDDNNFRFNFILDQTVLDCCEQYQSTIYHEFTHIMDDTVLNQSENYVDFFHKYSGISEIRASYIEYLVITGSKSITDFSVPKTHKIIECDFVSKPTPIEYLYQQYQNYLISSLSDNTSLGSRGEFNIRQLYYYIGFYRCIESKLNITIDHSRLVGAYAKFFGDSVCDLIKLGYEVDLGFSDVDMELVTNFYSSAQQCIDYYKQNTIYAKRDRTLEEVRKKISEFSN